MREFILGKDVLVENLRSTIPNYPKWITGKITANTGGIIHRRHIDQRLPSKAQVIVTDKNAEEDMFIPTPIHSNPTVPEPVFEQTTHHNLPRNGRPLIT